MRIKDIELGKRYTLYSGRVITAAKIAPWNGGPSRVWGDAEDPFTSEATSNICREATEADESAWSAEVAGWKLTEAAPQLADALEELRSAVEEYASSDPDMPSHVEAALGGAEAALKAAGRL